MPFPPSPKLFFSPFTSSPAFHLPKARFHPSRSLSLTKPNPEIRLPPHDMHLAPTFPVQVLVHKLQIVPPEHLRQYQVDLHHREAGKLASPRQRVISLQDWMGRKAFISISRFRLCDCFGLFGEMKDKKALDEETTYLRPRHPLGPSENG